MARGSGVRVREVGTGRWVGEGASAGKRGKASLALGHAKGTGSRCFQAIRVQFIFLTQEESGTDKSFITMRSLNPDERADCVFIRSLKEANECGKMPQRQIGANSVDTSGSTFS